jgi:hypothetical protein
MGTVGRLPNAEEWRALQGGEPIILQSPSGKVFDIIHAYTDTTGEFNGTVVATPEEQLRASLVGSKLLHFATESGDDVVAPATLLIDKHGQPCTVRSGGVGYPRLDSSEQAKAYIQDRLAQGWEQKALNPTTTNK